MTARALRVLVVDDSSFVRRAVSRVLAATPDVRLVGEAADGQEALSAAARLAPDVVLLDLGMPVMDGLSTLTEIRRRHPSTEVVVVSASAQKGAEVTLSALERGAFDFVDKAAVPAMRMHELGAELIEKIRAAANRSRASAVLPVSTTAEATSPPEVLVLGASTGGPPAIRELLTSLSVGFPAPIVLVQHMPASFIEPFTERLDNDLPVDVRVGNPGEPLLPGVVYVAPGERSVELRRMPTGRLHLVVRRVARVECQHVPSVDALFLSAAGACGERAWGVVLTGMGRDGAEGLLAIRRAGGLTVAQDQSTSAVFGMPRAAIELEAAAAVLPLSRIGPFLVQTAVLASSPLVAPGVPRDA